MLKKGDLSLIVLLVFLALFFFLWNHTRTQDNLGQNKIAIITHNGDLVRKVNLDKVNEPQYIAIYKGIKVVILAEKGRIRFWEAHCPDQICVQTGWLTRQGEKAVCLPSKTIIRIEGEKQFDQDDIDSITF